MGFLFSEKKTDVHAEVQHEMTHYSLQFTGKIPRWLSGTLVRNGPIQVTVNGESNRHWFDGLAMLHAFTFHEGHVHYTNKFLRSEAYNAVFKKDSLNYGGFAIDPCRSLFKRFFTFFFAHPELDVHNANINVAKIADRYVALTEIPLPVEFDLKTLETLGVLNYNDQWPKKNAWESAHPHCNGRENQTLNYLIKFGPSSSYFIYSIEGGKTERKRIAEIPVNEPSYMHSFAVTENYIILTQFPLVIKPLDLLTKGKAFIDNFRWKPDQSTEFLVIRRHNGELVGKFKAPSIFSFHHANAFENGEMIYLDLITYPDADIVTSNSFYTDTNIINCGSISSRLDRFSLSLVTGEITVEPLFNKSVEFPRINEAFDGRNYSYLYTAGFADQSKTRNELLHSECLYKINTETKEVKRWAEKGHSPGEPVFIAMPGAKEEDEGIVLALVLHHQRNESFLLILDGKTFEEIGRAQAPHAIPSGLHGQYFT